MKQTLIAVAVILVAALTLGGVLYLRKKEPEVVVDMCPQDVMLCPDGTSVPRSGPNCEFGACKQDIPEYMKQEESTSAPSLTPSSTTPTTSVTPQKKSAPTPAVTTNLFTKLSTTVSSVFKQASDTINKNISSGVAETPKTVSTPPQTTVTEPSSQNTNQPNTSAINETRYSVENNSIVDSNNQIIYTLPTYSANSSGTGMQTHVVNVVPVNQVAPIVGAIPVNGLPGKYYLSENSFGNPESCQFSNKIYILDTITNTRTLMFEENSQTLSQDDQRACNSEIYLLATENEKLILKYHTIGTNMICESTWSEPEKTWYLDVTKPEKGTRRYLIVYSLYQEAEDKETACRATFEATSTSPTTTETVIGG